MRYMRWDYPALLACPEDYVGIIADEAKREADEYERAKRG